MEHAHGQAADRDLFGKTPKGKPNWDHRRGEPRWFALVWTLYLMGAAAATLGSSVGAGSADQAVYQSGARMLVLVISAGAVLLWPMIRLCQACPNRPLRSILTDMLVVLLPVYILILPQSLPTLAGWSFPATLACIGFITAWVFLLGGVQALIWPVTNAEFPQAQAEYRHDDQPVRVQLMCGEADASETRDMHRAVPSTTTRSVWMLVIVLAALGGPAVVLLRQSVIGRPLLSAGEGAVTAFLLSPLAAGWECVRDRSWSGTPVMVTLDHWRALGWTVILAGGVWISACSKLLLRLGR